MFDKVTYTQYSSVLGRSVVPNEQTFNSYKLTNIQEMKKVLPFVTENEADGIDNAVCMMIESEYKVAKGISDVAKTIASENVSGHSVSFDNSAISKANEKNVRSLAEMKMDNIKLFCTISVGVC